MQPLILSEEERKKRAIAAYNAKRLAEEGKEEAGVEEGSFLEIPGVSSVKKKAVDAINASAVPGAGLAAIALDTVVPESLDAVAGKVQRGIKGLKATKMLAKENKAAHVLEKEGKDKASKLASELKEGIWDKDLAASPALTPDRLEAIKGTRKRYTPEQLAKFKEDREKLKQIKADKLGSAARK